MINIFKKKQCCAFVPKTNERCNNSVLWNAKYCWHHRAKIPIIIAFLIGIITSLIIPKVWESYFPSPQTKIIQENTEPIPEMAEDIKQIVFGATGGDSYFIIKFWDSGNNLITPTIEHIGKYTLYECSFKLLDIDLWDEGWNNKNQKKINDSVKEYYIGNIGPGLSFALKNSFEIKQRDLVRMKADISARNGFFIEMIHGRKINQIWRFAIRLSTFSEKILFEEIPNEFPKDVNGKYDWNS